MNAPSGRAAELVRLLDLQPHPEGGHYREWFRAPGQVDPGDGRGARSALTSIDFLLVRGQFSAWHRVRSDEAWHLLEGGPLRLWLMPPTLDRLDRIELAPAGAAAAPRHVVPAHWWQAAEPVGDYALCGATVAPGFEFADFAFLRADDAGRAALHALRADLERLL
ncbi:MAG: cupin domain-containing protein [Piscinibacter sp.]|nr:cupin domain-containing protein [Piscinibacter sp.]